ncbi:hypothetical protein RHGRI_014049 [Rhododendron griersonianum]|uniref:Uncharacterized protein n=1 Tax=Rhododendron griersonianum TaxID=479676 RepID=A0AAV6K822_9ERIC|nr:hypothetical protein RHGRI_014049 [Rhododendron griersonianum]
MAKKLLGNRSQVAGYRQPSCRVMLGVGKKVAGQRLKCCWVTATKLLGIGNQAVRHDDVQYLEKMNQQLMLLFIERKLEDKVVAYFKKHPKCGELLQKEQLLLACF